MATLHPKGARWDVTELRNLPPAWGVKLPKKRRHPVAKVDRPALVITWLSAHRSAIADTGAPFPSRPCPLPTT